MRCSWPLWPTPPRVRPRTLPWSSYFATCAAPPSPRPPPRRSYKGAVYALEEFQGKLLAGVNNKLQMYGWGPVAAGAPHGLVLRAEHCGHILVLYIHTRGDFILTGDLMKSMTLLQLVAGTGELPAL